MVRISAIIPAYNEAQHLERAVDSLLATGYPDLEIVVVDDGSVDGTWELAQRLACDHAGHVISQSHPKRANRGVSATRNLGIEQSSGELISFLDADDYVYPHRFESAVARLSDTPDVDGVYQVADVAFADAEAKQKWFKDARLFGFTEPISPDRLLSELLTGMCWATSAILFRRSLMDRTGCFVPKFGIAEDCHLWMRMACVGKLVAGDLSRPVSVYWRSNDSAYQPSLGHRVAMIRVMSSFLRWMRRRDPNDSRLPSVRRSVEDYAFNAIVQARAEGERRLAWLLAWETTRRFPRVLVQRRFAGNLGRAVFAR